MQLWSDNPKKGMTSKEPIGAGDRGKSRRIQEAGSIEADGVTILNNNGSTSCSTVCCFWVIQARSEHPGFLSPCRVLHRASSCPHCFNMAVFVVKRVASEPWNGGEQQVSEVSVCTSFSFLLPHMARVEALIAEPQSEMGWRPKQCGSLAS
jgi:hypothetical protein